MVVDFGGNKVDPRAVAKQLYVTYGEQSREPLEWIYVGIDSAQLSPLEIELIEKHKGNIEKQVRAFLNL